MQQSCFYIIINLLEHSCSITHLLLLALLPLPIARGNNQSVKYLHHLHSVMLTPLTLDLSLFAWCSALIVYVKANVHKASNSSLVFRLVGLASSQPLHLSQLCLMSTAGYILLLLNAIRNLNHHSGQINELILQRLVFCMGQLLAVHILHCFTLFIIVLIVYHCCCVLLKCFCVLLKCFCYALECFCVLCCRFSFLILPKAIVINSYSRLLLSLFVNICSLSNTFRNV